jgi:hypothetical protein
MYFWIDGHEMRVIEVDGVRLSLNLSQDSVLNTSSQTDIEPYPVDQLNIAVAQRYSVLVTARNDTGLNWAIHANFDTDMVCPTYFSLRLSAQYHIVRQNPKWLKSKRDCFDYLLLFQQPRRSLSCAAGVLPTHGRYSLRSINR